MKKINWKRIGTVIGNALTTIWVFCAILFLSTMIWYYVSAGSRVVVHDNGCDRIMNVYSESGDLLETYTGFISILRMDGDTTVYDWDGSCITVQGGIVTVQDVK